MHPRYFDRQALIAGWREALLAQAVLAGRTKGYGSHPQLERFRNHPDPSNAIGAYLRGLADEADARGYRFDRSKIIAVDEDVTSMQLTTGQLSYEWTHLMLKLKHRSPAVAASWSSVHLPEAHPLFTVLEGPIAAWERPKI